MDALANHGLEDKAQNATEKNKALYIHCNKAINCNKTPDDNNIIKTDIIAKEVPISLSFNGTSLAVMMASPIDFYDFAYGFSKSEGIINHYDDIEHVDIVELQTGFDIQITLKKDCQHTLEKRRRHMAGPVGCGLCGIENITAAMRTVPKVHSLTRFTKHTIFHAVQKMDRRQILHNITHAVHGAGFYHKNRGLLYLKEDVGRHNALDKLCGRLLYEKECKFENIEQGFIVVTSRLSMEMVQKAAMSGIAIIVAFSAPTSEAIRVGKNANMTLIGRARNMSFEIYCGEERIEY